MAKEKEQPIGDEAKGLTEAYFVENKDKGLEVSLNDVYNVKFTKDFGFIKKDQVQRVSEVAYEIYKKAGVIEKVN